jgi:hypothetical protein
VLPARVHDEPQPGRYQPRQVHPEQVAFNEATDLARLAPSGFLAPTEWVRFPPGPLFRTLRKPWRDDAVGRLMRLPCRRTAAEPPVGKGDIMETTLAPAANPADLYVQLRLAALTQLVRDRATKVLRALRRVDNAGSGAHHNHTRRGYSCPAPALRGTIWAGPRRCRRLRQRPGPGELRPRCWMQAPSYERRDALATRADGASVEDGKIFVPCLQQGRAACPARSRSGRQDHRPDGRRRADRKKGVPYVRRTPRTHTAGKVAHRGFSGVPTAVGDLRVSLVAHQGSPPSTSWSGVVRPRPPHHVRRHSRGP